MGEGKLGLRWKNFPIKKDNLADFVSLASFCDFHNFERFYHYVENVASFLY